MMARLTRPRALAFARAVLLMTLVLGGSTASGVDDVDLHDLNWYVHVDLVTVTEDLSYWQNLIDESLESANALVEGGHGPVDTPCCSRLARAASVSTFGAPGDGFDVIDSAVEQNALNSFGGPGSNAYFVDSINYCGGPAEFSVGCAGQPSCSLNGNDNPNLWMAVTVDSLDGGTLPQVIAHERGHNACLSHVSTHACQIMQGVLTNPGLGGCLTASECSNFRDGRTTTSSGLECGCHATGGGVEPDGEACTDVAFGLCSGGLCGDPAGDAAVKLIAAAHPGSAGIPAPDDALVISALTGDWSDIGQITPTADDIQGLAYARDSATLYGVIPSVADDSIVTLDPNTGDLIAVVGTIANGSAEMISMAYHPGATSSPSDDRLIMMEATNSTGAIVWVDPAAPFVRYLYGFLSIGPAAEFKGLAYDSAQGKLFASTPIGPNGLYEIDLSSCPPSPCPATQVVGADELYVFDASLSFSPQTGMLYQMGTTFNSTRTFYNVIDPTNGTTVETLSLDELTPGGLAAVPEPVSALGLWLGCVGLHWAGRRRRRL
jgi:hypothetical protein